MPTTTPYAGESSQRLVDLLNQANGTNYELDVDFTFGPIEAYSGSIARNTRIRVIPIRPGFTEQYIYFNRLSINALSRRPEGALDNVPIDSLPVNIHEKLDDINEALGLNLAPEEVQAAIYDDVRDEYPLTILPGASHAWIPSTFNFKIDMNVPLRLTGNGGYRVVDNGDYRVHEPVD